MWTNFFGYIRRLLSGVAFLLSIAAATWLMLCFAASFVHPGKYRFLALFSLTTPFALLVNVFFLVFFLLSKHKARLFLPMMALAATYKMALSIWGIHYFTAPTTTTRQPNTFRIMTWNVHGLGIYDRPRDRQRAQKMMQYIKQYQPDFLSLIEFYTLLEDGIEPHGAMFLDSLGYKEYRFSWDNTLGTKIFVGNAIFSKYPLSNFKTYDVGRYIRLTQCDVALPGNKKVRGFFVHLQSFHLNMADKRLIEEAKLNPKMTKQHFSKGKGYVSHFNNNYVLRALQADSVSLIMDRSPYPVFMCADLNDLPASYTYTTVRGNRCDAHEAKGRGLGRTYNMFSPTLRIDYIFYDKGFLEIKDCATPITQLSDHNPVIATFSLP